jgi:hypothetical protein
MLIQKKDLQNLIRKYDLNGLIEGVKLSFNNDNILMDFSSSDRSMFGSLECKNNIYDFQGEIGIIRVGLLKSMLGIMGDEIDIKINNNGVFINKKGSVIKASAGLVMPNNLLSSN